MSWDRLFRAATLATWQPEGPVMSVRAPTQSIWCPRQRVWVRPWNCWWEMVTPTWNRSSLLLCSVFPCLPHGVSHLPFPLVSISILGSVVCPQGITMRLPVFGTTCLKILCSCNPSPAPLPLALSMANQELSLVSLTGCIVADLPCVTSRGGERGEEIHYSCCSVAVCSSWLEKWHLIKLLGIIVYKFHDVGTTEGSLLISFLLKHSIKFYANFENSLFIILLYFFFYHSVNRWQ